jgi:hypothetical protein
MNAKVKRLKKPACSYPTAPIVLRTAGDIKVALFAGFCTYDEHRRFRGLRAGQVHVSPSENARFPTPHRHITGCDLLG